MRTYAVYILSNTSRMLYIGVTGDLDRRIWEHKKKLIYGFTSRYNIHSLVYLELFGNINAAIAREKELKRWGRSKKVELVRSKNPNWIDLAATQFKKLKRSIRFPDSAGDHAVTRLIANTVRTLPPKAPPAKTPPPRSHQQRQPQNDTTKRRQ